jgi:hypothetical protein
MEIEKLHADKSRRDEEAMKKREMQKQRKLIQSNASITNRTV